MSMTVEEEVVERFKEKALLYVMVARASKAKEWEYITYFDMHGHKVTKIEGWMLGALLAAKASIEQTIERVKKEVVTEATTESTQRFDALRTQLFKDEKPPDEPPEGGLPN